VTLEQEGARQPAANTPSPGFDPSDPNTIAEPYSGVVYAYDGYPLGIRQPEVSGTHTQADTIGDTSWAIPDRVVGITSYIDQTAGGSTGTIIRNGYSGGLNPYRRIAPFTGGRVVGVRRNLAADTGPVGRNNHLGVLQAGVASQNYVGPTLEEIYRSFVAAR
jgi:hypothetical protein